MSTTETCVFVAAALCATLSAAYGVASSSSSDDARDARAVHVLSICNGSTDGDDVARAVAHVYARARDPRFVFMHIVSPFDALVEHNSFRVRSVAAWITSRDAVHTAMHANVSIHSSFNVRASHARADASVLYLPLLHAAFEAIVSSVSPDAWIMCVGAPNTFTLQRDFDAVLRARSAVDIVSFGDDVHVDVQRSREFLTFVLQDGAATVPLVHPESFASRARVLDLLFNIVRAKYATTLLMSRSESFFQQTNMMDWMHRVSSRAGYGSYTRMVQDLGVMDMLSSKKKRAATLRLRDEASRGRARLLDCVALTLATEVVAHEHATEVCDDIVRHRVAPFFVLRKAGARALLDVLGDGSTCVLSARVRALSDEGARSGARALSDEGARSGARALSDEVGDGST